MYTWQKILRIPTTKSLEIKYVRTEVKNVVEELEDEDEDLFQYTEK